MHINQWLKGNNKIMSKVYKMRNTFITRYFNSLINKYKNAKFEVILLLSDWQKLKI